MGETTKIAWAHSTFNPWTGCSAVSAACDHCYARDQWAARTGRNFSERRRTTAANWRKPLKWDSEVAAGGDWWRECGANPGDRRRVFPSLCDPLDTEVPIQWFADFLELIMVTPNLTWLLLTKRPENWSDQLLDAIGQMSDAGAAWAMKWYHGEAPLNVRMGITAESQEFLEKRMGAFLKIPSVGRFLSCEPLLGALDVGASLAHAVNSSNTAQWRTGWRGFIDWVIAGGESGPKARPCHPDWVRSLRDQCQAAGVPFMWKQWGEWAPLPDPFHYSPVIGSGNSEYCRALRVYARKYGASVLLDDRPEGWPAYMITDGACIDDGEIAIGRVGKKLAGHLLDGVEHMAMPEGW